MPKRVDSVKLQFQIPREIVEEMKKLIPEILDPAKPTTFRWGGLQQYFQSILIKDLAERRKSLNAKR
jgi:hypothetical protein